jgi:hypothetical protein
MPLAAASRDGAEARLPTTEDYKSLIAKANRFRDTQKLVRPVFQAFQGNVAAYGISVLADKLGDRIVLDHIWVRQAASPALTAQIATWAREVNEVLHRTAGGRMVSEWAKKPECRDAVLGASYSAPSEGIPEVR